MAVDPISTGTGAIGLGLIWAAKEGVKLFINKRNKKNNNNNHLQEINKSIKELNNKVQKVEVQMGQQGTTIKLFMESTKEQFDRIYKAINGK